MSDCAIMFISAFIGAWIAYYFNVRQKNKEQKDLIRERYSILAENASRVFSNLIIYKNENLDKIKEAYDTNDKTKAFFTFLKPDIEFTIDISQYVFLTAANSRFLSCFKDLERMTCFMAKHIEEYYNIIRQLQTNNLSEENYQTYKNLFYSLYNKYEELCTYSYFILSQMNRFYSDYFNLNYLNNIKESFQQSYHLENDVKDYQIRFKYSEWEQEFSKGWTGCPNFWCRLCFAKRCANFKLNFIKFYFRKPLCHKMDCPQDPKKR